MDEEIPMKDDYSKYLKTILTEPISKKDKGRQQEEDCKG